MVVSLASHKMYPTSSKSQGQVSTSIHEVRGRQTSFTCCLPAAPFSGWPGLQPGPLSSLPLWLLDAHSPLDNEEMGSASILHTAQGAAAAKPCMFLKHKGLCAASVTTRESFVQAESFLALCTQGTLEFPPSRSCPCFWPLHIRPSILPPWIPKQRGQWVHIEKGEAVFPSSANTAGSYSPAPMMTGCH